MAGQNKPVLCVETGEIFGSMAEAARNKGIALDWLRRSIKRGQRCQGLTFARIEAIPEEGAEPLLFADYVSVTELLYLMLIAYRGSMEQS
eukprot:g6134.t1